MATKSHSPSNSPRNESVLKRPGRRGSYKSKSYSNLPVLKGYLKKKSRQDKWQKRWFEVNGQYLTYYKTPDADKLLACIDLWRTGEIAAIPEEPSTFSIAIGDKFYVIKADSPEEATQWIEGLKNRQHPDEDSASPTKAEVVNPISSEKPTGTVLESNKKVDSNPSTMMTIPTTAQESSKTPLLQPSPNIEQNSGKSIPPVNGAPTTTSEDFPEISAKNPTAAPALPKISKDIAPTAVSIENTATEQVKNIPMLQTNQHNEFETDTIGCANCCAIS